MLTRLPDSFSLKGKTALVTGGAGYLGSAITRALDAEAAQVVCIDLPGRAEALVQKQSLKRTIPVTLDVNDPSPLPAAIDQLVAEHGLPDGVAHLAFSSSSGHRLEDLPAEKAASIVHELPEEIGNRGQGGA